MINKPLLSFWALGDGKQAIGNAELFNKPLTAFFASRQCSGGAIRAAMDWAVKQAQQKTPVISGFHSPLEKSVLEVLLAGRAPCVIVLARKLEQAHLPSDWLSAIQMGTTAIVSIENTTQRLTVERAARRNDWVAKHAVRIAVAHANPNGVLQRQIQQWQANGCQVQFLITPASDVL
jgi:predicted Rossmann fold nucleotide-binding protein DprA/Smf involved in DNA uptake